MAKIVFAPEGTTLAETDYFVTPNANGQFEIRGVSPGSYVLLATADDLSSDVLSITVADTDIDMLAVLMLSTVNIGGRVVLEGRSRQSLSGLRVKLVRSNIQADQKLVAEKL